ncbi:MAG: hypothetical protein ABIH52_04320 [Candidatus Aenigmatarchaeota archaeon]
MNKEIKIMFILLGIALLVYYAVEDEQGEAYISGFITTGLFYLISGLFAARIWNVFQTDITYQHIGRMLMELNPKPETFISSTRTLEQARSMFLSTRGEI